MAPSTLARSPLQGGRGRRHPLTDQHNARPAIPCVGFAQHRRRTSTDVVDRSSSEVSETGLGDTLFDGAASTGQAATYTTTGRQPSQLLWSTQRVGPIGQLSNPEWPGHRVAAPEDRAKSGETTTAGPRRARQRQTRDLHDPRPLSRLRIPIRRSRHDNLQGHRRRLDDLPRRTPMTWGAILGGEIGAVVLDTRPRHGAPAGL